MEGWAERVSELEAEMRRCEVAHSGMQQDVANKDERIKVLLVLTFIIIMSKTGFQRDPGNKSIAICVSDQFQYEISLIESPVASSQVCSLCRLSTN